MVSDKLKVIKNTLETAILVENIARVKIIAVTYGQKDRCYKTNSYFVITNLRIRW
jgi:hypothetical protein